MFSGRDNNLLYIKKAFKKSFSSRLHQNFFQWSVFDRRFRFVEMKRITKKYSKTLQEGHSLVEKNIKGMLSIHKLFILKKIWNFTLVF